MSSQTVLITGASSGIGESAARKLHALGFTVYAAARRVDRMADLAAAGIHVLAMDVTDDASMTDAVARIVAETGRIDVLVNNAGYGSYGSLEEVPLAEGRAQFEVNLFGLARLTQLVTPHMRARGSGRIINISSIGGKFYEPLGAWYHATKFAVEGLSNSLRLELRPFGIDVVVIEPGAIRTEWSGIAQQSLLKTSGQGPYRTQAEAVGRVLSATDRNPRLGAPASVIGATIVRAAADRRPKTRYAAPFSAKLIMAATRLLPDRMLDGIISRAFRMPRRMTGTAQPAGTATR